MTEPEDKNEAGCTQPCLRLALAGFGFKLFIEIRI